VARWCETCDRPVEGDVCEVCGNSVEEQTREPIPWRWRFFIVVTIIYVIWRIYQLVSWLSHH
jgi:predicted RNA-binding protein with PUA domain